MYPVYSIILSRYLLSLYLYQALVGEGFDNCINRIQHPFIEIQYVRVIVYNIYNVQCM